jgi:hypothetical protein
MSIHINATCQVAKSFSVKREKQADDSETVVAHLKVGEIMLDRDQLDELCAQPIGWSAGALFDEFGAPRAHLSLVLTPRGKVTLSGVVDGGKKPADPRLKLKDADVGSIMLDLTKLGAMLSCQLSWAAAGDEVDDIADMLGKTCNIVAVLEDGGQGDLLDSAVRNIGRLAQQDGIESVELQVGGKTIATFGKKPNFPVIRELGKIKKTAEVLLAMQQGYTLMQYGEHSYRLERCVGGAIERRECWLQAARGAIKRGLTGIAEQDSEYGQWQWKEQAA